MKKKNSEKSCSSEKEEIKEFLLEDFVIEKDKKDCILGVGSFATVYLAICKKNMKKYAIKAVK